jgi:hypothetical protein
MLSRLDDELKRREVGLRIVEAHGSQRDILRAEGLEERVGPLHRDILVSDILAEMNLNPPVKTV